MIEDVCSVTCVTLLSGVVVANFASPHAYLFTDGTVLPAVETTIAMSRVPEELFNVTPLIKSPHGEVLVSSVACKQWIADDVARDVTHLLDLKHKDGRNTIDILVVPSGWYPAWLAGGRAPSNRIRSAVKAGLKWRANEFGVA